MKRFFIGALLLVIAFEVSGMKSYVPLLEKVKRDKMSERILPKSNVTMKMLDDNTISLDGSVYLAEDLPDDTRVCIDGYERNKDGKTYQEQPSASYCTEMCDFLEDDTYVYQDVLAAGNYPPKCPVKKGWYTLTDCIIGRSWPDNLPGEYWKFLILIQMKGETVSTLEAEVHLDRTPKTG